MQYQLVLTLIGVAYAAAIACKGRANLLENYAVACMTDGRNPAIAETHSCLRKEVADTSKSCTAAASCTEVNIMAKDQQFHKSADMVWSFSSCFKQEMDIRICAEDDLESGTTTMGPTTTAPNTTVADAMNTTTTTTTEPTTTTGELTSESTSTQASTSSTKAPTTTTQEYPEFDGCWEGKVTFTAATCAKEMVSVNLTNEVEEMKEFDVQVLGCCNTDNCEVSSSADETNTCNFGKGSDFVDTTCSSACFTYIYIDDGKAMVEHGCLADFSQDGLEPYTTITECTSTYEDGVCQDAGDDEGCIRCCTGANCNSWLTKDALLGTVVTTTTESSTSALLPTLTILAFSWLISVV